MVWGESRQRGKAFAAAFILNTSNAPQFFPKSLCPSEFVCVCAQRELVYIDLPPLLYLKQKPSVLLLSR